MFFFFSLYSLDQINDDEGFTEMAFKDDDGYWRVTGKQKKYLNFDALLVDYPSLT